MAKKKQVGRPKTGQIPTLSFRAPLDEQKRWRKTAKAMGKTLSQWLRDVANAGSVEYRCGKDSK